MGHGLDKDIETVCWDCDFRNAQGEELAIVNAEELRELIHTCLQSITRIHLLNPSISTVEIFTFHPQQDIDLEWTIKFHKLF